MLFEEKESRIQDDEMRNYQVDFAAAKKRSCHSMTAGLVVLVLVLMLEVIFVLNVVLCWG